MRRDESCKVVCRRQLSQEAAKNFKEKINDEYRVNMSAFRDRGVPGPTSEMSLRAPAQMGRREAEREGGRKVAGDGRERGGNPAAFVFVPRPGRVRLQ
jgi:hypothetical protein